jgi:hypothetical protein
LLIVFVGEPHCLWSPKSRWNFPLGAPITLKIGKNGLEAKKLQPFKVRGFLLQKQFD